MDVLKRGRYLRLLVELSKREPMNMQEFMEASDYVHDPALQLRNELQAAKLIVVKTAFKGRERSKEIWLTPVGRRMAEHAKGLEALAEEALKTNGEGYESSSSSRGRR